MDCIDMVETPLVWGKAEAHRARELYQANQARRQARQAAEKARLDSLRHPQGKKSLLITDILAKVRQTHAAPGGNHRDV
ncbi:hypothetical protein EVA_05158 [gut metagenome]|uniref:Uncharacterized protein n=1 Tax=gut metagenome TaxID=749906 RepID=J9H0C0_9ZZZZ